MMKPLWLLLITALLPQVAAAAVPEDIQQVAFEYFLSEAGDDFVYCLGADGQDAAPNAIESLRRLGPTLAQASECTANVSPREGSTHTSTGRLAIFYYLLDFKLDGATSATITFETCHHGLWASGNTVRLERRDGVWHVAEVLIGWVS